MALASKTSKKFYVTSGGGNDEIAASRKAVIDSAFDADMGKGSAQLIDDNTLGPVIYNIQRMQDDLDELRRFVVSTDEAQRVIGNGVVYENSVYYIPITSSEFMGFADPRGGPLWGMTSPTEVGSGSTAQNLSAEKVIPIGFKATGCIAWGDNTSNQFRGYEGAINASTNTAQGGATNVGTASDFTTDGGSDIVGDGFKTCAVHININNRSDGIFGGRIILEIV